MTLRVLVFAEDVLGMTLARDLCDRVIIERGPDWLAELFINPQLRDTQRSWSGINPAEPWTKWGATRNSFHAHAPGLRGYSLVAYRAAYLAARLNPLPNAVVLCIDTDGCDRKTMRKEMIDGFERANTEKLPFALAVAHQESEAWVVAGFVPEHRAEKATLEELENEHGFAPTVEPHRMTPRRPTDPHDAKRVCGSLFPDGTLSQRATRCWLDTPLDELSKRGAKTGLRDYLGDIARVVLPLLGAPWEEVPPPRSD